jgi:hypothetical protein
MVASRVMPALFHHDVHRLECRRRGVEQSRHVRRGSDVAPDADRVGAQRGGGFLSLGLVQVANDDSGAVDGESARDRKSDALSASGYDGGASCKH